MGNWYQKLMPRVKDVKDFIPSVLHDIKKAEGVKSVFIWGSLAKNYNSPYFRVRDIDVIAKTEFDSGDLMAITNEVISQNLKNEELENQGFNPSAIKFSKSFIDLKKYNVDHWAVSKDNKLMHWGIPPFDKKESEEIKKLASSHALELTGVKRKDLNKASQELRNEWYDQYDCFVKDTLEKNVPSGWYASSVDKKDEISQILENAIPI